MNGNYKNLKEKKMNLKIQYPIGSRIKVISLVNVEPNLPNGSIGTVVGYDDAPSLLMSWDNGSSLSILPYSGDKVQRIENLNLSNLELFAYEQYVLEWCVEHNVLPKDIDEGIGIGGECYVCMDEFFDNEFEDADIHLYYEKRYYLNVFLQFIWDNCTGNEAYRIFKDEIHLNEVELNEIYGSSNLDILKSIYCSNKKVERTDILLANACRYIRNIGEIFYKNFVVEFCVDRGMDIEILRNYITLNDYIISEEEFNEWEDSFKNRAKKEGVKGLLMPFHDYAHLNAFWYSGTISRFEYRDYVITLEVSKLKAKIYDEFGDVISEVSEKTGSVKMNRPDITDLIKDDEILLSLKAFERLKFEKKPMFTGIIKDKLGRHISIELDTQNVLNAQESLFNKSLKIIKALED